VSHLFLVPSLAAPKPGELRRSAVFSPCGQYRYRLTRSWARGDVPSFSVTFVMLNPSVASHEIDDPTIRRCMGFARAWGAEKMDVVNLFGWRATDPRALRKVASPIGPENEIFVLQTAKLADRVVCAWGTSGGKLGKERAARLVRVLGDCSISLSTLGLTQDGTPRHPLYLAGDLVPQPWKP